MIRKVTLLAVGALMGATAMSAINGFGSSAEAAGAATYRQLAIFGNVFERVRAQYVTPPEEDKLIENAINGMLTSLDPHSSYLNQEAADDMRTQTRGEFGGLGHRGHDGRRAGQGDHADRRDSGRPSRCSGR
jgi:carboxyl-terminal processing protease